MKTSASLCVFVKQLCGSCGIVHACVMALGGFCRAGRLAVLDVPVKVGAANSAGYVSSKAAVSAAFLCFKKKVGTRTPPAQTSV